MIVKLSEGCTRDRVVPKINEIIAVINAITDGAENFCDGMDRDDFRTKVMQNLRTAQETSNG